MADLQKKEVQGLDYESIRKIYGGKSKIYDAIFKRIFYPRIKHAIASMDIKRGDNVLDVGVGTGLSLSFFPSYCDVTGIDLSSEMLVQARKKVDEMGVDNIKLMEMDAMDLKFPNDTFDKVFISHVVTVVPDPYKMVDEIRRVCKNKGRVVIINHFKSKNKMVGKMEKIITPLSKKVGWRSDLDLDEFIDKSCLRVDRKYKLKKLDLWHVIFAINEK